MIGHGTRDAEGTAQFIQLSSLLAQRLDPLPVEGALLEFQEPTITQGWDALAARGVSRIQVAPLLLFAAGHAREDIPSILRECQSRCPAIQFDQARPLSRHRSMIELSQRRLESALSKTSTPRDRTAVVMVGRGSHDPCAQADMRILAEVVSRRANVAHVTTAFNAMAHPRLPTVLNSLASRENVDTIVIQPHLLFEGRLVQAIRRQTEQAAEQHPAVKWTHAACLGPDPLVAEAVAARAGLA